MVINLINYDQLFFKEQASHSLKAKFGLAAQHQEIRGDNSGVVTIAGPNCNRLAGTDGSHSPANGLEWISAGN